MPWQIIIFREITPGKLCLQSWWNSLYKIAWVWWPFWISSHFYFLWNNLSCLIEYETKTYVNTAIICICMEKLFVKKNLSLRGEYARPLGLVCHFALISSLCSEVVYLVKWCMKLYWICRCIKSCMLYLYFFPNNAAFFKTNYFKKELCIRSTQSRSWFFHSTY